MSDPKYIQVAPRVEELYWEKTSGEIQDELNIGGSTYSRAKDYANLPPKTNKHRLEHIYGVPADWILDTLHNVLGKSVNMMSDDLPVSRKWISDKMDSWGLDRRGRSEAESLKWDNMSTEEREAQVKAAHEKIREKYENGNGTLQIWKRENPEKALAQAKEAAALGTPARETNGMAGVTGQDHPSWRGSKSIYDALKKQLRPSFDSVKEGYRDDECCSCGKTTEEDARALDVHHIVPLLCGGTNDEWNMMTFCTSCHHKAEWYTRSVLEPVLVE